MSGLRGTSPEFYTSEAIYEAQRERIFPHAWHFAADVWRLPDSDWAVPYTLLGGCLDEPMVLTRSDDQIFALSNVCTHRGALLVSEEGPRKRLICPYHGRRFGLNGQLQAAPGFEGCPLGDREDHLPNVDVATFGPLIFVNLDPKVSLPDLFGGAAEFFDFVPWGDFEFSPEQSRHYELHANWALYVDNYLEGLHIPFVHSGLAKAIDLSSYEVHRFDWSVLQVAEAKQGEPCFDLPPDHPHAGRRIAAYYLWLFPGTMINLYPWGLSLNIVQPVGVDRTRISYLTYVSDPERLGEGAGGDVHEVEREDQAVVHSVMRGMRSRFAQPVQYAPGHEEALRMFHDLAASLLA